MLVRMWRSILLHIIWVTLKLAHANAILSTNEPWSRPSPLPRHDHFMNKGICTLSGYPRSMHTHSILVISVLPHSKMLAEWVLQLIDPMELKVPTIGKVPCVLFSFGSPGIVTTGIQKALTGFFSSQSIYHAVFISITRYLVTFTLDTHNLNKCLAFRNQ